TDKNEKEAFRWFRESAKNGHTRAQNELGFRYEIGSGQGTKKDETKAFCWHQHNGILPYAIEKAKVSIKMKKKLFNGFENPRIMDIPAPKVILEAMNML
ncbi:5070_t:CDS:1, partial [Ambispora gerdemannii]